MIELGLTDHLEGARDESSRKIFDAVMRQMRLADKLGFEYAWFAEHHAHAHFGHLPAPLLLALHLAGQTKQIRLGTAIICLNLHHPLAISEQTVTADLLSEGRMAFGFGSGSTPEEFALFGHPVTEEDERHAHFESALRLIQAAWRGQIDAQVGRAFNIPAHATLPIAAPDLSSRSWLAVNSVGAARIAGKLGFSMLFSHLRTPEDYQNYAAVYREAGGRGKIAANRPVLVAESDEAAIKIAEPALRLLWRRFRTEGKIASDAVEPTHALDLCAHPINFIVGGPATVADQLLQVHRRCPFDVANLEVRWPGLSESAIESSLRLLARDVRPRLLKV